jgi:hypothetical protein
LVIGYLLFVENMGSLLNIFKSNSKENWQILALEIGGEFIDSDFRNSYEVILTYRKTRIILDTYTVHGNKSFTYSRLRCSFVSKNGITFEICPERKQSYLDYVFRDKKIKTGNIEFDSNIYCRSKHLKSFKSFLDSNLVQEEYFSVMQNSDVEIFIRENTRFFSLNHTPPRMNNVITLEKLGGESDIEVLKSWFNLCKMTLDRLIEIGEAEDVSPDI